ncbi:MAG: hypothetical protein AAFR59_18075, partial [Bacteroidota bacterium]
MALKRIHRRIIRTVSFSLGGILVLVGVILWLVRYPAIQTYLVDQSQYILSDQLGIPVEIQDVDVALPAKIVLGGMRVCDQQGENVLKVGELKVSALNFKLWDYLLSPKKSHELRVNDIQLVSPEIFLYKRKRDAKLNLQDILDVFASEDTTTSEGNLALVFDGIQLENAHFIYIDSTQIQQETATGRVDFGHLELNNLGFTASLRMYPDSILYLSLEDLQLQERISGYQVKDLDLIVENFEPREEG